MSMVGFPYACVSFHTRPSAVGSGIGGEYVYIFILLNFIMNKYYPRRKKYELVFQRISTVPQLDIKFRSHIHQHFIPSLLHEEVFREWVLYMSHAHIYREFRRMLRVCGRELGWIEADSILQVTSEGSERTDAHTWVIPLPPPSAPHPQGKYIPVSSVLVS